MPRIDDYNAAIALAAAELQSLNPKRLAARSRTEYILADGQEAIIVPYFGLGRRVTWPEIGVAPVHGPAEIPLTESWEYLWIKGILTIRHKLFKMSNILL